MNDATHPDGSHDAASPAVDHLGRAPEDALAAMHAKTDPLRDMGEAWAEGIRSKVRNNPLASIAAALALGLVIARLKRGHHPPR